MIRKLTIEVHSNGYVLSTEVDHSESSSIYSGEKIEDMLLTVAKLVELPPESSYTFEEPQHYCDPPYPYQHYK